MFCYEILNFRYRTYVLYSKGPVPGTWYLVHYRTSVRHFQPKSPSHGHEKRHLRPNRHQTDRRRVVVMSSFVIHDKIQFDVSHVKKKLQHIPTGSTI